MKGSPKIIETLNLLLADELTAVSQYMVEHRVPGAAEVVVSSQATTDARGGRVVGYAAATPAGERLTVEYSERLRRVVNMNLH